MGCFRLSGEDRFSSVFWFNILRGVEGEWRRVIPTHAVPIQSRSVSSFIGNRLPMKRSLLLVEPEVRDTFFNTLGTKRLQTAPQPILELFILTFILTCMASVVRRDKSKYWTACFTSRDGRQLKRSTKTTDRRVALQIALDLERVELQARAGVLTTTQLQKVLSDVSEEVTGDRLSVPTVEDYFKDWLQDVAARNAERTHIRYQNTVGFFLKCLGSRAQKPIAAMSTKDIDTFLGQRVKSGLAPKTALVDLKTLSVAFKRAQIYGYVAKNPVDAVRRPKDESSEREVFTHEEVQRLLDAAPSVEWQTLILLGYFVGARLRDCVEMQWENVHPEKGVIIYQQGKTGKRVCVPMHYHVIEHLKYLSKFGTAGPLCPKLSQLGPAGKTGLSQLFINVVRKAGLDPMTVPGKGIRHFNRRSFHSLRHSFVSALANAGVTEEVRMKLTGHSSKAMSTHYTHLEVATLKNAVASMPVFGTSAPAESTVPTDPAGES